jgi:hypothetical protein
VVQKQNRKKERAEKRRMQKLKKRTTRRDDSDNDESGRGSCHCHGQWLDRLEEEKLRRSTHSHSSSEFRHGRGG